MAFLIPVGVALIAGGVKGIGKISQAVNHKKTRSNHEEDGPGIVDERGMIGGWLSKRAVDKTTKGKSSYTRNYSWKPRYFRQTETGSLAYCVDKDPAKPPKGEIKFEDIKVVFPRKESDRFVLVTLIPKTGMYGAVQLRAPTNELRDIWLCNLIIRLPICKNNPELIAAATAFLAGTPEVIKHGFAWSQFLNNSGEIAEYNQSEEEHFGDDDGDDGEYYGGSSSSSSTSVASPRGGGGGGGGGSSSSSSGGGNNDAAMRQYQQKLREWEASTRERCFGCKGQGFHKCTSCKGSGRNNTGKPCSSCSGKGQFNCLKCSSHKGLQYGPKGKFTKPQPPK